MREDNIIQVYTYGMSFTEWRGESRPREKNTNHSHTHVHTHTYTHTILVCSMTKRCPEARYRPGIEAWQLVGLVSSDFLGAHTTRDKRVTVGGGPFYTVDIPVQR